MPNLTSPNGEPTGALSGVINMVRKIAKEYKADYMACVFDAKGKTFRHDLYQEYKATRPAMPEELRQQIAPIHEAIASMGWPVIAVPGVEADDVIATLAKWASDADVQTLIFTGDKDMAQLVSDNVTLLDTMKRGKQDIEALDIKGVKQKYGVYPEQIIDYLMLIGDTSDNVPGVSKVGPKTAEKWLNQYQTLDNLIEHADDIKGVVGQNLRDSIEQFGLTRDLITLRQDCAISDEVSQLQNLTPKQPDVDKLVQIAKHYGLNSFLNAIYDAHDTAQSTAADGHASTEDNPEPAAKPKTACDYQTVVTKEVLQECLEAIKEAPLVALDTETNALHPMQAKLVGISLSVAAHQGWYIPVAHQGELTQAQLDKEYVLEQLQAWLNDADSHKVLHNAKFDMHVFANEGIALKGVKHDTMLMAYVLDSAQRVALDKLAGKYLGETGTTYEALCGKGKHAITFDQVAIDKAAHYACEDADFTWRLWQLLEPQISDQAGYQATYELEMQVMPVICQIERNGVKIDTATLRAQSVEITQRLQELEAKAHEVAGSSFNLNSTKQLGEILFAKLQLPVLRKTPKGVPSTDEEVLSQLAEDYPLPKIILQYRSLAKLKSTYTDKLPEMIDPQTGRIHTNYSQASVVTGRLASLEPNLQNIPVRTEEGRKIREAFVADKSKCLIAADYSQIELRVMAHLSGDENLLKAFQEGQDIHRATAAEIFNIPLEEVSAEQRRSAKAINFGLIYGMGAFGLAKNLNITREAAQLYIDRYFERYPGVATYMESIRQKAVQQGYVETVFGRRLWFRDLQNAPARRRAAAERAAINAPMQGTAADLIKKAMVRVQHFLEQEQLESMLIMQVHDELVLEVPEAEKDQVLQQLPALMTEVADLKVGLEVETGEGENWRQAH